MLSTSIVSLFFFLNLTSAKYTCNASNAVTVEQLLASLSPPAGNSGSGSSSGSGVSQDDFNSVVISGGDSFAAAAGVTRRSNTQLECDDDTYCLIAFDGFMCLDPNTLDFEDSKGGSGNGDNDIYTMENGQVTSIASTATGFPIPTGSGTATAGTGTAGTGTAGTGTTKSGTAGSNGATAAAAGSKASDVASEAEHGSKLAVSAVLVVVFGAAGVLL